jgi:hypothetical protein
MIRSPVKTNQLWPDWNATVKRRHYLLAFDACKTGPVGQTACLRRGTS